MDKGVQLKKLQDELETSYESLPLATKREDLVHGEGEIFMIGEGPGYYEAVQRRPFVGRSGQLLRRSLQEIGLSPETTWITNIIKVRPPENRDPTVEEIEAFRPSLNQELEIIKPLLIVTLGRFSLAKFLPDVRISQVHGRLHKVNWEGRLVFVLPMYHPAAALRGTRVMESFKEDLKKLPKILEWAREQKEVWQLKGDVQEALF
ncbi:MAG: Phage SPO1 DNA polymerase-related protein [Candidatus Pacebacteria bacterium GW2011_GWA1_46_10]|nr:MAG: Phage SPO1 DNA polymerase-related protein [Candidatus Pacebacteria bacterium GW2011_GWA1_46_10]